jgi:hypothetical protein
MRKSLQVGTPKRFAVPAEFYAHRSPVRQEKEGAEELREERREGKRQWK